MEITDFVVVSDLHIDVNRFDVSLFDDEANQKRWLLILGDTFTGILNPAGPLVGFVNKCSVYFKGVIFLLGNHDYYGDTIQGTKDQVKEKLSKYGRPNVVFLDGDTEFRIPDTNIVVFGDTWWSNMPRGKEQNIEDYMRIKSSLGPGHLTFAETNAINDAMTKKIKDFLSREEDEILYKVVLTHFPFFYQNTGYPFSWLTNYFHNEHLESWINEDWMKGVSWLHGHDHVQYFTKVKDTYFFSNARGYSVGHYQPQLYCVG